MNHRAAALVDASLRAWGRGDVDALDEVLHADYCRYGRSSALGRTGFKDRILEMRRAFPDLHLEIESVVADGDQVAIHWRSSGTLMDDYLGLPATGRTFTVTGATFSRYDGDLVVEERVVYDRRGQYAATGMELDGRPDTPHEVVVGPDAMKAVHRRLVTGVTVVATLAGDEPRGLAVNAFSSVSLEPPLILVCVQKNSSTYAHLMAARHFSVNVLAADQVEVANTFATKQPRKFDHVSWRPGDLGQPIIDGVSAAMEVALQDTVHASTHTIFIGRVVRAVTSPAPPLIYTDAQFFDSGNLEAVVDNPS